MNDRHTATTTAGSNIVAESDWLASESVFYNTKTGAVSRNINDVIDWGNVELDSDGFNNYLDYGFCVFERTPVKNVRFLRHSAKLLRTAAGTLEVQYDVDPAITWDRHETSEEDVIEKLKAAIEEWENSCTGDIVIPTSGGYDSRALNLFVKDKTRIRSFTYGVSKPQNDSHEVTYAQKLTEIFKTRWAQVELGEYHHFLNEWDQLFGVSTHAHGMYHIEFYKKIRQEFSDERPLASGIIGFWTGVAGDQWSAGGKINVVQRPSDMRLVSFNHGMNADSRQSKLRSKEDVLGQAFESLRTRFSDPFLMPIEAMRLKMILSSYLLIVPKTLGFFPWSPFILPHIAMSMLSIPEHRRKGRKWINDMFRKHGVCLEEMNIAKNGDNSLNEQALWRVPLRPLRVDVLREVIAEDYVEWINRILGQRPLHKSLLERMVKIYPIGPVLHRCGYHQQMPDWLQAYCGYLTLYPIERLLLRRRIG